MKGRKAEVLIPGIAVMLCAVAVMAVLPVIVNQTNQLNGGDGGWIGDNESSSSTNQSENVTSTPTPVSATTSPSPQSETSANESDAVNEQASGIGGLSNNIIYVHPGESIQAAIDSASAGDTIIVMDGTYTENLNVDKSLTIRSENSSDSTVIKAQNPNDNVIDVTADGVSISGFTITGGKYGIALMGSNCIVNKNTIKDNTGYGVYVLGSNNYVYDNEFIGNNINNPGHQAWDNSSNYWNTTTIGNYWTDWDDNTPTDPGNYSIDGGTARDYEPRGLFVFSVGAGTDKWAFRWQINQTEFDSGSPVYPGTEFTDAQYANITEDDDVRQEDQTTGNGNYSAHRFNFSINSSLTSGIDKINITWNGIGDHDTSTDGAKLYIFNFSSTTYEQLDSDVTTPASAEDVTLTGGKTNATGNIFDYINGNNVTILVNPTSAQTTIQTGPPSARTKYSYIKTDYIKLVITPE